MRIDPAKTTEARRLLQAAIRYLRRLEHPSGVGIATEGPELLRSARARVHAAAVVLETVDEDPITVGSK